MKCRFCGEWLEKTSALECARTEAQISAAHPPSTTASVERGQHNQPGENALSPPKLPQRINGRKAMVMTRKQRTVIFVGALFFALRFALLFLEGIDEFGSRLDVVFYNAFAGTVNLMLSPLGISVISILAGFFYFFRRRTK